jgi:hypothetical protein
MDLSNFHAGKAEVHLERLLSLVNATDKQDEFNKEVVAALEEVLLVFKMGKLDSLANSSGCECGETCSCGCGGSKE